MHYNLRNKTPVIQFDFSYSRYIRLEPIQKFSIKWKQKPYKSSTSNISDCKGYRHKNTKLKIRANYWCLKK